MMMAENLRPGLASEAVEALARARHDLGKYVALSSRCLAPTASDADLREALRADLCHTRSSPPAGCGVIWAELRPDVLAAGVDTADVDASVALLTERGRHLEALSLADLQDTAARAIALGNTLRALHRAAVAAHDGAE